MNTDPGASSGLRLERFTAQNADLVLSWRNAPHVRTNFLSDAEITREGHLAFLDTLERRNWHFFILSENDVPLAVLNVNKDGTDSLWGCYIGGDIVPRPGLFPVLIGVAGVLAFDVLGCDTLNSDVLRSNPAPQKINTFLGIPEIGTRTDTRPTGEMIEVLCYRATRKDWPAISARMDKILTKSMRDMLAEFAADPLSRIT
ncbi:hypothetical protein [Pseudorhodobacter sp.]|uniref:hypothetical protein n=1 Tax=Pseudorhodobacter sp. TaxID=1934400 RepID=UPI0026489404|nr:hypothetical protein [Pseudorhodobacter sp.]MDN5787603.1 hypothetical protein [Pseudorhodobacter sp.]